MRVNKGSVQRLGEHARRSARRSGLPSESPFCRSPSTSALVLSQTGTAAASRVLPCFVTVSRRPRRSEGAVVTSSRHRRSRGFQCGGQGRAVHGQQRCYGRYAGRLRAVQRHHQGELAIGQAQRPQRLKEQSRQNFLDDLSNSSPAVRQYSESSWGRLSGLVEIRSSGYCCLKLLQ